MSDTRTDGGFHVPASAHEFWALAISLLTVFVLVQFGAPIVREFDFLDEKLREYFIGIAFIAFPVIHRGVKQGLSGFKAEPAAQPELAPWYVTGVFAAALLFAWNQLVSLCAAFSASVLVGLLQVTAEPATFAVALATSTLAVSLPMSAIASVLAGIALNRGTRSRVFAALAAAAVTFVAFNVLLTWAFQPEFLAAQLAAVGPDTIIGFAIGLCLVGFIVFVFGALGIAISRWRGDASLGRLVRVARHLSPVERDAVIAGILHGHEIQAQGELRAA